MANFSSSMAIITWDYIKKMIAPDEREREFIELLIFSSSLAIEQYCKRMFRMREIKEFHDGTGQNELIIGAYPVREILGLYCDSERVFRPDSRISNDYFFCDTVPEDSSRDCPTVIYLDDEYVFPVKKKCIMVHFIAGFSIENMPDDIKTACLEILMWRMQRINSRQVGSLQLASDNRRIRKQIDDEMPASIREILDMYRRIPVL